MQGPFSERFGDIYFSAEGGLEETRHVFLAGNGLPEAWQARRRFTIAETGFGTGLNFLAAWTEFECTAPEGAVLDYIAVELYPLTATEIEIALDRWRGEFGGRLEQLLAQWPMRVPGFHRLHFPRVRLTLIFDDANVALPQIEAPGGVDAWFLDGFAPAKNPGMWSETLYREMARLSAPGASVATFTAAGMVRRGLAEAGFAVEKKPGFGRKRDMTVARFPGNRAAEQKTPRSIAIIGGGLAGTACAWSLQQRGLKTTIYEQGDSLAPGASGNALGLCNPRFSALRTPESDFYTAAFAQAHRRFAALSVDHDIGFKSCGSLHLINNADKEKRFAALIENWGWGKAHLCRMDVAGASDAAGITLPVPALFLPQSMQVSPAALCHIYSIDSAQMLQQKIISLTPDAGGWLVNGKAYDAVILANGAGVTELAGLDRLPVHTVRGQITMVRATLVSSNLRTNLCFGGYISAPYGDGLHMVGSSFQKWLTHTDCLPEDDADNLANLAANIPALAADYRIVTARAALRLASRDHFPITGPVPDAPNLFLSTAHGSHGIISSLACAELIADMADGSPRSLPLATQKALSVARATKFT